MSHTGGVVNDQEHIANTQLGRHERTCDAVEKWLPRDLLPCACQEHSDKIKKCAKTQTKATKVRSIYRLPNLQDINPHTGTFYKMSDINKFMMVDLMTEGTLYAAFRVYEDFDGFFQNDPMGVYQHRYGQMIGGHAIVIVGWGEQDGVKYWLIPIRGASTGVTEDTSASSAGPTSAASRAASGRSRRSTPAMGRGLQP
jgi:hypothetical protein